MILTAGELIDIIRDECAMELGDLGNSETEQNDTLYRFLNVVLRKRVRQAFKVAFSDSLTISADGYQTFLRGSVDVTTELYEPQGVFPYSGGADGVAAQKRTSWEAPTGWIHEDAYSQIHTRGLSGSYRLKYLRYPANVSASGDVLEYPQAGYWDLIYDVASMVKLIKNAYDESIAVRNLATGTASVKASTSSKGTNSSPPSPLDKEV